MPFESSLVNGTRFVITLAHVFAELLIREHLMLVCEHLFVPGAEVAHLFMVHGADMTMQIWPAEAGEIAVAIGTVVSEEENGIAHNVFTGVSDPDIIVGTRDLRVLVLFETFAGVIRKNHKWRGSLGILCVSSTCPPPKENEFEKR